MKTIEEFTKYIKKKNITIFIAKKPGVVGIIAQVKTIAENVDEIKDNIDNGKFQVWESFYNNKWYTFIRNVEKAEELKLKEIEDFDHEYKDDYISEEEAKHWTMNAYEYYGDPDKFHEWLEANGY